MQAEQCTKPRPANRMEVELDHDAGKFSMRIANDDVGKSAEPISKMETVGLQGMRERRRVLDACLQIDSVTDQ